MSSVQAPGPDAVRNLDIWRLSIRFVGEIYRITRDWPREELYGLTVQVRRAAVSVPANIAEGVGRHTPADTARFVQIALASLYEVDTLLEIATQLGYAQAADLAPALNELLRKTSAFIGHQKHRAAVSTGTHRPPPTA